MHVSVLLNEAIENLNIKEDGIYVDCTLGYAGHSKEILKRIPVDIKILGVIGTKVTKRYTQAYKQMQLNKKKYAQ